MNDAQMLTIACSLVATLFGLLVAIIAWGGSRVIGKLEDVAKQLGELALELNARINGIDIRLAILEAQKEDRHG